jgi:hypothetical protein
MPGAEAYGGVWKYLVFAILFVIVAVVSYLYFQGQSVTSSSAYGVKVVSDGPLDVYLGRIQANGVALLDTKSDGGLTCNFELLATLFRNPKGYTVGVEDGEQGIFLYQTGGLIKGMSEREVVTACNAFACLACNITCPENTADLGKTFEKADEINIVLDADAGPNGGRGYVELLGVLGYMQAERIDVNKDGVLSQFEIYNLSGNFMAIRPYLMENGSCRPQPLHNLVERFEPNQNESVDCSQLSNTLFVLNSSVNSISLKGSSIYLSGDDDHLYREAVIVRDGLSPKWVRELWKPRSNA